MTPLGVLGVVRMERRETPEAAASLHAVKRAGLVLMLLAATSGGCGSDEESPPAAQESAKPSAAEERAGAVEAVVVERTSELTQGVVSAAARFAFWRTDSGFLFAEVSALGRADVRALQHLTRRVVGDQFAQPPPGIG